MSMSTLGQGSSQRQSAVADHVRHRLRALRHTPPFIAALTDSALGTLPDLIATLSADEIDQLDGFEREFLQALRLERLGEYPDAAMRYRALLHRYSRYRPIIQERLAAIGHPVGEPAAERHDV